MKTTCLGSSSHGNCFVLDFEIKDGRHSSVMVECGLPYRTILQRLNDNCIWMTAIQSCVITHGHGDHCKAAHDLTRRGMALYASQDTLTVAGASGTSIEPLKPVKVADGVYCIPFEVIHDIAGAYGFVFKTAKETTIFVNDNLTWEADLSAFKPDTVMIECNYDGAKVNPLYRLAKYGGGDKSILPQLERNIRNHSSLRGTIRNLKTLDLSNCGSIILMHLSDRFANEYIMKNEVQSAVGIRTFVAQKNGGIK